LKPNLLSDKKVIITAAITGGIHGKWANPALPLTAEEQAQAALKCYEAGASILHIHVRGDDGQNTPDLKYYGKTVRQIGEKCPIYHQIGEKKSYDGNCSTLFRRTIKPNKHRTRT